DWVEIAKEFWGNIRHFREITENRNKYLEEFRKSLEKAGKKYNFAIRYYTKIDHYFWEELGHYGQFALEIIVDDKLWGEVVSRLGHLQVSIVKEGEISSEIGRLKKELDDAQKRKDVLKIEEIKGELTLYLLRRILITIADNYVNLKRRGLKR
ncbi:hypothetical protein, partial [Thermococcus sp. GR4]|uniref:hypothetical protein n=3 Tax=Thermococcus TaxID=2263 RepID=UPI001431C576